MNTAEKSSRESVSKSQSADRVVSDLQRRLAESEGQDKVARRAQIAAEKHVLQLQGDLQEAQEQQLHSKDVQIALQSRQITSKATKIGCAGKRERT